MLMMSLLNSMNCGAAAGIACPLFQDLSFGLQSSAARKPERAMGGAKDELKLDDALASIDNFVDEKFKD